MAGYSDPQGTHNPATGTSPPAAWGDLVRDDIVWLAGDATSGNPKPMCRVYNNATLGVATATWTALTFNSERYDVGGLHSTTTNTDRITIPSGGGGVYHISGQAGFDANATGGRLIRVRLNATTTILGEILFPASASFLTGMAVAGDYKLAAGDYLTLEVYQSSGGILNITSYSAYTPEFACHWVGVG